jgi:hypothetical protein
MDGDFWECLREAVQAAKDKREARDDEEESDDDEG